MFIAIILSLAAIGFVLWLLFTLAVYALPFYAGLTAALWAFGHGAGFVGAALVGLVTAGVVFGLGQVLFATLRSPWLRAAVAGLYSAPAGVAGYFAVYGVSSIGGTGEAWRVAFAVVGAVSSAATAWIRVSALYPGSQAVSHDSAHRTNTGLIGAANDG